MPIAYPTAQAPTKDASPENEAFKYWGLIMELEDESTSAFPRLMIAICDYIHATADVPVNQMTSKGAKVYLNPEMVDAFDILFNCTQELTAQESEYLDIHTRDKIRRLEYELCNLQHDMATREGGPERNMPYLTRGKFALYICIYLMRDPLGSREKLNQLMASPDHLILDPYTDEPFKFPLPLASLPSSKPEIAAHFTKVIETFTTKRAKIIATRRAEAIANGEMTEAEKKQNASGTGGRGNHQAADILLQAAENQAMLNLAKQEMYNQVLFAQAQDAGFAAMSSANF
ncbi:hypothetical protein BT63DRAFT_426933 [Microthyrium microscopicum]|uniref:Uncharacterized protein n=1 Tax=Microthyrium microscopicum TaxID=703497 RepID=A0A6A6U937_9PEZI|nr:hypothetical protein BT63DRAFT_426933 [Microthyrium microscopicum]